MKKNLDHPADHPADDGRVIPLRRRQPQPPRPRSIELCPHGVPLHLDCAECHGIDSDDGVA